MENQESWLRKINKWIDQALLDTAKPLMLIMFLSGTADVLTQGWLANQEWFSYSWAIVQALAIDGLFFAVWSRIFSSEWKPGNRMIIMGLIVIGLVLSVVVMSTNAILSFQQLWAVRTSMEAMIRLGIDPKLFTFVRSILVVGITIMVAFVYHKSHMVISENATESANHTSEQTSENLVSTSGNGNENVTSINEKNGKRVRISQETKEKVISLIRQGATNLTELAEQYKIPMSTVYRWNRDENAGEIPQAQAQYTE